MGTSGTPLQYVIVDRLGAFFYWTRVIWQQCIVRQYYSNLSDQSALEISVRIRVRLRVALFLAFFTENNKNEHLIFREFHGK